MVAQDLQLAGHAGALHPGILSPMPVPNEPDPSTLFEWAIAHFGQCVCSLVCFQGPAERPEDALFGGTGTFVYDGQRHLILTANHVIARFEQYRRDVDGAATLWALGAGPRAEVSDWAWVRSWDGHDIAALVVPSGFAPSAIGLATWSQPRERNTEPVEGDYAYVLGFPGEVRQPSGSVMVSGRCGILEEVASVSDRHFIVTPQHQPRETLQHHDLPARVSDLGGMSGAPAFLIRDGKASLAGVAYEAGGDLQEGVLFVAHLKHLPAQ